jgi:hypothetical protein
LHLTLLLIELLVALLYALLLLMKFLFCLTNVVFMLQFEGYKLLLSLNDFVFLDYFGVLLRLAKDAIRSKAKNTVADTCSY